VDRYARTAYVLRLQRYLSESDQDSRNSCNQCANWYGKSSRRSELCFAFQTTFFVLKWKWDNTVCVCDNLPTVTFAIFHRFSYTLLFDILVSRITPCVDKITGYHHCGFRRNRSTTDQIFDICQILEKKREYNDRRHQLFIDFEKAYDLVRIEVLYNVLTEFGIPMKL
jgi:hypothetical protein